MRRLLTIFAFSICCLALDASSADSKDAVEVALAKVDAQIAHEQQAGSLEKEGEARWQKILTLKNYSKAMELIAEADVQMEWFRKNDQWDNYYRTWQLKANNLCSEGKLQQGLQETQRMLNDANERDNKLGRAMAYKQIGIIYLNMKQTEPAVEALQHYAELMKDESGDFSSLSNIYYRMSKAYDYDKAYEKELEVNDKWISFLHEKVGKQEKPEVRECYNSCYLARTSALIGLRKFEEASMALDTAAHHAHLVNTSLSLHHLYKMKARYYLATGDAGRALLYTDSVKLVTSVKDEHTAEVRALALMMLGYDKEAASIYQRLFHDKDSVYGAEARQHLDELNTLFQLDDLKREQQLTKLRYFMIAVVSIVLALLVLLLFGWRTAIRQKKVNEQLRIANERANVSAKMKTEFIRNISHEIRTPLNILSGFTQILTTPDMELLEDEKKNLNEQVTENTYRITHLIDRMLELSDASSEVLIERKDQTDAQAIVADAIEHSRIDLQAHGAAVKFEFPDPQTAASVALLTNKLYAVRALAQLLENAAKFTHEGRVSLRMESTDRIVRFTVEDTGIGIPSDKAEHIFGEFVQLDEFVDGTGIGLPLARSIARRMGGDLWLDTSYSRGARFVFELLR